MSVKPPVEAPMLAHTRPEGSTRKWSSAGASFNAPRLANAGSESTAMSASSLTERSGLRTVSPPTRTLPARIRACARSRDSARPFLVTRTSRRVTGGPLEEEADHQANRRADDDLERRVSQQLAEPQLLYAAHVHEILHQAVQDLGLTPGGAAQTRGVVHDH